MAADRAVRAGRNYLPIDPGAAVYVADEYARLGGVGPDEIAITRVSPDNRTHDSAQTQGSLVHGAARRGITRPRNGSVGLGYDGEP
jgi:hypothetical protein